MATDFYMVLGISPDADLDQIKQAYRRMVKLYHPDASEEPVDRFHEVREAYDALTDPDTRADHDRRLPHRDATRQATTPLHAAERRIRRAPARMGRHRAWPAPPASSELDELFGGFIPGIYRRDHQTSTKKDLFVELILSPDEARAGGLFPLKLPIERACEACDGHGYTALLSCESCRGRGRVVQHHAFDVTVPPGVAHGTARRLSLRESGLRDTDLIVRVLVACT